MRESFSSSCLTSPSGDKGGKLGKVEENLTKLLDRAITNLNYLLFPRKYYQPNLLSTGYRGLRLWKSKSKSVSNLPVTEFKEPYIYKYIGKNLEMELVSIVFLCIHGRDLPVTSSTRLLW